MSRKRLASSDSNPDSSESLFWNKRVMAGSTFDANRAEPSQQPSIVTPLLDMHRAESSRQHVRALNSQFASWVQTQLKNHPDELWEDGVRDYLSHASSIMEKFSDVVKWLEANTLKGETLSAPKTHNTEKNVLPGNHINSPNFFQNNLAASAAETSSFAASWNSGVFNNNTSGLFTAEKKPLPESKDKEVKTQDKPLFASLSTSSSFANPWSSGVFSSGQIPVFTGIQNSGPAKVDASEGGDDEDELEQPSSPSVKKSEEKGIVVVHEVKCKLYVKSTDPADKDAWKDKGAGQLSIKCKEGVNKGTKESKPTIVVRNDVGKVLLNALLYPGIKTSVQKNSLVAIFHTADDGGSTENVMARTFLIRLKTGEDRDQLATAIQEYAPAS